MSVSKGPLSPLDPIVIVYSSAVQSEVSATLTLEHVPTVVSYEPPPELGALSIRWSADKRTLTLSVARPYPLASSLRLKVSGAKDKDGDSFDAIDLALKTKRNPLLQLIADTSVTTVTNDAVGRPLQSTTEVDGKVSFCTRYSYTESSTETRSYPVCDQTMLSSYGYSDDSEGTLRVGSSQSLGTDGEARTSDDVGASYQTVTRSGDTVTVCTSTGAGADGRFVTPDDEQMCGCAQPDPNVSGRSWFSSSSCDMATASLYTLLDDSNVRQRVVRVYNASTPGTANENDMLLTTQITRFDERGLPTQLESKVFLNDSAVETTTVYSYDDRGNRLVSTTSDQSGSTLSTETFDPSL